VLKRRLELAEEGFVERVLEELILMQQASVDEGSARARARSRFTALIHRASVQRLPREPTLFALARLATSGWRP
jgi:hypothetical protein